MSPAHRCIHGKRFASRACLSDRHRIFGYAAIRRPSTLQAHLLTPKSHARTQGHNAVDIAVSRIRAFVDGCLSPWPYGDYGRAFLVVTYYPGTGRTSALQIHYSPSIHPPLSPAKSTHASFTIGHLAKSRVCIASGRGQRTQVAPHDRCPSNSVIFGVSDAHWNCKCETSRMAPSHRDRDSMAHVSLLDGGPSSMFVDGSSRSALECSWHTDQ